MANAAATSLAQIGRSPQLRHLGGSTPYLQSTGQDFKFDAASLGTQYLAIHVAGQTAPALDQYVPAPHHGHWFFALMRAPHGVGQQPQNAHPAQSIGHNYIEQTIVGPSVGGKEKATAGPRTQTIEPCSRS